MCRFVLKSLGSFGLLIAFAALVGCNEGGSGGGGGTPGPGPVETSCGSRALKNKTGVELARQSLKMARDCSMTEEAFERLSEGI